MTRGFTALCAGLLAAGAVATGCKQKVKDLSICPEMVAAGKATEVTA